MHRHTESRGLPEHLRQCMECVARTAPCKHVLHTGCDGSAILRGGLRFVESAGVRKQTMHKCRRRSQRPSSNFSSPGSPAGNLTKNAVVVKLPVERKDMMCFIPTPSKTPITTIGGVVGCGGMEERKMKSYLHSGMHKGTTWHFNADNGALSRWS